jgi:hypothetical protein
VRTIRHESLVHPAGLTVLHDVLYVLEQQHRALLTFQASSGAFKGKLIDDLADSPEDILISPAC